MKHGDPSANHRRLWCAGEILDPGGPAAVASHPVLAFPYLSNAGGDEVEVGIINKESYDVAGTVVFYQANGEVAEEIISLSPSPFT